MDTQYITMQIFTFESVDRVNTIQQNSIAHVPLPKVKNEKSHDTNYENGYLEIL